SGDANELLFSGCSFLGNRAGTWGGGLSGEDRTDAVNTVLKLEGCLFHQNYNKIYGDGSGLFFRLAGQEVDFQLTQSTFSENFNNYYATAAIWAAGWSGASGQVTASHCTFRNNSAKNSAGLDMGSPPGAGFFHYRVANCSFFYNEAKKRGGGLTVYSESPATYEVEDCLFEGNFAGGQGGALWLAISNPGLEATIRNCIFKYNESPLGGALLAYPLFFPATREASIRIENSLFVENVSANAVIAGKYSGTIRLANSTIAQNHAGAVLSGAASSFELQNTILYNPEHPGPEASLEDSTAVIRFLGGNLSRDIGIQGLLNPTDQVVSAPLPLLDNNYRLVPNSSAIDAGMAYEGMPDYDLAGNNRLQGGCIDAGAYESPYHSGNGCQVAGATEVLAKTIQIYPNPAGSFVEVHLPLPSQRPFEVWLYDNRGRMVLRQKLKDGEQLNVERLLPGFYWVKAAAEGVVFTGKLITAKK
ncbi:MAG: T9SS type A sorting domain-containing protein, partial [Phaeodactylibacter sp.]|nr:T9SS type A sorting domain-containing protein [Phaeodactylibacter sp.]